MFQTKPLILSQIKTDVMDHFSSSTAFWPDTLQVDFRYSTFAETGGESKTVSYLTDYESRIRDKKYFWLGNLSSLESIDIVRSLYISNNPSHLIYYANKFYSKIKWHSSVFIATSFHYNIDVLKTLFGHFNQIKVISVFPSGNQYSYLRAITELALLKDNYSIVPLPDAYLITKEDASEEWRTPSKDFYISHLQRQFKYRVSCRHHFLKL